MAMININDVIMQYREGVRKSLIRADVCLLHDMPVFDLFFMYVIKSNQSIKLPVFLNNHKK